MSNELLEKIEKLSKRKETEEMMARLEKSINDEYEKFLEIANFSVDNKKRKLRCMTFYGLLISLLNGKVVYSIRDKEDQETFDDFVDQKSNEFFELLKIDNTLSQFDIKGFFKKLSDAILSFANDLEKKGSDEDEDDL